MAQDDIKAGHELDGSELRQLERFHSGVDPLLTPGLVYGYQRDSETDEIVLMPIRERQQVPVDFRHLST